MPRLVGFALACLALAGCRAPETPEPGAPEEEGVRLNAPGWAPENRERIVAFLRERGRGSQGYDPGRPPTATLDFDMTTIFDDCGDATFYYQAASHWLALTPEQLAAHVPSAFVTHPEMSCAAEREELLAAYRTLHAAGLVGGPTTSRMFLDGGRLEGDLLRAHLVFRHRLIWFYEQLQIVDGARVAYPWVVGLYAGLRPAELQDLVGRMLARELRDPSLQQRCQTLTVAHPDPGVEPLRIREGLVANVEMRELYEELRRAGIDPYIVTASFGPVVAATAARLFDVSADHVVGMRLGVGPDGAWALPVLEPITYREGKVAAIAAFVPRPPIFAAGDSDTDVEMLLQESVQLRLLLDRKKSPTSDVGKLYERARATDRERWLIQGRDDFGPDGTATGAWNGTTRTP